MPPSKKRAVLFSESAPSAKFAALHGTTFLHDTECERILLGARVAYSAAWMLMVSADLVELVARLFREQKRLGEQPGELLEAYRERDERLYFAFNLAGEPLIRRDDVRAQMLARILPLTDVLFGNDAEYRALALAEGWHSEAELHEPLTLAEAQSIVRRCATLLRPAAAAEQPRNDRLVVMTRGAEATVLHSRELDEWAEKCDSAAYTHKK